jgi:hypothetical protein
LPERENIVPQQAFKFNSDPTATENWDLTSCVLRVKQENSAKKETNISDWAPLSAILPNVFCTYHCNATTFKHK